MPKIILLRKNERIITVEQLQSLKGSIKKISSLHDELTKDYQDVLRDYRKEHCLGSLRVEFIKDLVKELSEGLCESDCVKACCGEIRETCIHFGKRQLIRRAQRLIDNV